MALRFFWHRTTQLDRLVILLLLVGGTVGTVVVAARPAGETVVVEQEGRVLFRAPLAQERSARLPGPLGESLLRIGDGSARLLESPCPHQVCIGMGGIRRAGELLACIPNRLLVRIEGEGGEGADYDLLSH